MARKFQTLSQRFIITRKSFSPHEVLNTLLLEIIRHFGPIVVGHAKTVAQVEGGIVYASTTGMPPTVEVKTVDNPAMITESMQVDLLCVFHGIKAKTLTRAWQEAAALLTREGFHLTTIDAPPASLESQRQPPRAWAATALSFLPSFLALKPCCLIPVLGSFFGGSVSILHLFAPFEPYRPVFMLASLGLLGFTFHRLYVRPIVVSFAEETRSAFTSHALFWLASSLFVVAVLSPWLFPKA